MIEDPSVEQDFLSREVILHARPAACAVVLSYL